MGDDETTATSSNEPVTTPGADATADETTAKQGAAGGRTEDGFDLKGIVRQLTAPMIESLDTRLRDQIEAHVDELLTAKLDAALAARFSTVDRAIADLSRSLDAHERRLAAHEEDATTS